MGTGDHRNGGDARPRRLLALNHFANPLDAPGGTRLIELSQRLDGWETTIVAAGRNLFTRERHTNDDGGDYRAIWTTPYATNGAGRIVNWASFAVGATFVGLDVDRPDVVYASSPHLLAGLSGWFLARYHRAPFVLEIRDLWPQVLVDTGRLDPTSTLYRLVKRLELFLYRHADAVVTLTEGVARCVQDEGVPAVRVHVIPNGADPADFSPSAPRAELRRRYGFDGITFVYAGAHGPANGLDFVLDAAAEVARSRPEAHFVLVGDGLSKRALRARAAREHLDHVRFLDPIPKNEIPDLLAAADVGLHVLDDLPLFLYGVSPNKLFDYMAAGRPVLTNTGGEVGDIVKTNDAGVAVAPSDLAAGVRQLIDAGAEQRDAWGAHGQAFMTSERSRTRMAHRLQILLDDLAASELGSPPPARPGSRSPRWLRTAGRLPDRLRSGARLAAWRSWEHTIRTPWTVRLFPPAPFPALRCYAGEPAAASLLTGAPDELAFIRSSLAEHHGLMVDLGAGTGLHTVTGASTGTPVVAFEGRTTEFLRLTENVRLNRLDDRVALHHDVATIDRAVGAARSNHPVTLLRVDASEHPTELTALARDVIVADRPIVVLAGDHDDALRAMIEVAGYDVRRGAARSHRPVATSGSGRHEPLVAIPR